MRSAPAVAVGSPGQPLGLVFRPCTGRGRGGGRTRQLFGDCSARAGLGTGSPGIWGWGRWVIPAHTRGASLLHQHIKHRDEASYKYYIQLPRLLFMSDHRLPAEPFECAIRVRELQLVGVAKGC